MKIYVRTTKEELDPEELRNATAVVIDVLLATTTLVTMMENEAKRVYPADSILDANSIVEHLKNEQVITGGELEGIPIEGFTCGPLPEEFSREKVKDKNVVFLSTNGTRAIRKAKTAKELLLANLRNSSAVARYLQKSNPEELYLLCSGTSGHFCIEDFLCAGLIISRLDIPEVRFNDAAKLALYTVSNADIWSTIAESSVGTWLIKNGFETTVRFAAEVGTSQALIKVHNRSLEFL